MVRYGTSVSVGTGPPDHLCWSGWSGTEPEHTGPTGPEGTVPDQWSGRDRTTRPPLLVRVVWHRTGPCRTYGSGWYGMSTSGPSHPNTSVGTDGSVPNGTSGWCGTGPNLRVRMVRYRTTRPPLLVRMVCHRTGPYRTTGPTGPDGTVGPRPDRTLQWVRMVRCRTGPPDGMGQDRNTGPPYRIGPDHPTTSVGPDGLAPNRTYGSGWYGMSTSGPSHPNTSVGTGGSVPNGTSGWCGTGPDLRVRMVRCWTGGPVRTGPPDHLCWSGWSGTEPDHTGLTGPDGTVCPRPDRATRTLLWVRMVRYRTGPPDGTGPDRNTGPEHRTTLPDRSGPPDHVCWSGWSGTGPDGTVRTSTPGPNHPNTSVRTDGSVPNRTSGWYRTYGSGPTGPDGPVRDHPTTSVGLDGLAPNRTTGPTGPDGTVCPRPDLTTRTLLWVRWFGAERDLRMVRHRTGPPYRTGSAPPTGPDHFFSDQTPWVPVQSINGGGSLAGLTQQSQGCCFSPPSAAGDVSSLGQGSSRPLASVGVSSQPASSLSALPPQAPYTPAFEELSGSEEESESEDDREEDQGRPEVNTEPLPLPVSDGTSEAMLRTFQQYMTDITRRLDVTDASLKRLSSSVDTQDVDPGSEDERQEARPRTARRTFEQFQDVLP
ncbi:hypothetical protein V1264_020709 [Littorina saxatilis]|uniref:Uncharacterized protein n=1 Tax=Littorina saxatilis TaxID=31220 RepID=A0AAN9GD53_9CAEN